MERAVEALGASGKSDKTVNRTPERQVGEGCPSAWQQEGKGRITFVPENDDYRVIQWLLTNGRRDQAMVYEILVTTKLRIGELLTLKAHEVDVM